MNSTKQELIDFLEQNVLYPAENNPKSDVIIKRKIGATRMRLSELKDASKVEEFFWHAMVTDNGIDTYTRMTRIGAPTFELVRLEFKRLCDRK